MSEKGEALKEYTVKSFAQYYRVDVSTARKYLNTLVENGKATLDRKPLHVSVNGRKVATKRTVTTYRIEEFSSLIGSVR